MNVNTQPNPDENATLAGDDALLHAAIPAERRGEHDIVERGEMIGRYVVLAIAGHGGMGVVYRAYDPELQREVALKLLRSHGGARGEIAAVRLRREAQAMARVSHPNVLPVYDAGELGGRVWIAMEFLQAQTLTEWLAAKQRPWRDVVAMFLQAGRGLAAAHEVGLVHRDFKPANVLVGPDGRPRVMDFGLARTSSADSEAQSMIDAIDVETSDVDLTAAGGVVGTPRYMAPEQHYGRAIDGRADQFAFCVALFEGLYRVRAFTGDNLPELALRKQSRRTNEVGAHDIPSWLDRVVRRGLEPAPEDRFATMEALLTSLATDPRMRRRRIMARGVGALLVSAGILGGALWTAGPRPCRDAERKMIGVWDDARRERVATAMRDTDIPYAVDAAARVRGIIDGYALQWITAHDTACAATKIHGEQSEELLDARITCLDRARAELAAMVDVLEQPDATVVEMSVQAVGSLRPLGECDAAAELLAVEPAPRDPESVEMIARIGSGLARGGALLAAGKAKDAQAVLEPVVLEARALGYRPLLARALVECSAAVFQTGDAEQSRVLALEAVAASLASDDLRLAVDAFVDLAYIDGYTLGRPDRGHEWAAFARGILESVKSERLEIELLSAEAVTYLTAGDLETGQRLFEEAVARERARDPSGIGLGVTVANVGSILGERGQYVAARAYFEEAIALSAERLGVIHPETLDSQANLATLDLLEGRYPEAIIGLQAVADDQVRVLGPDHPRLANTYNNLANALRRNGDHVRAIEVHRKALAVREKVNGPDSLDVAQTLQNLSSALRASGQLAQSRPLHDRAARIRRSKLPDDHPDIAATLANEAELLHAEGDPRQALVASTRALVIREKRLGPGHSMTVLARIQRAVLLRETGDAAGAIVELERSLADARELSPDIVAQAMFDLAKLLPDRARARRLAAEARSKYKALGDQAEPIAQITEQITEIDAWLAAHP